MLILDNDIDQTAKSVVEDLKNNYSNVFDIKYFSYPVKGISNARNELLKQAFLIKPDFILFIDDDEYVTKEWMNELVSTMISNKETPAMTVIRI